MHLSKKLLSAAFIVSVSLGLSATAGSARVAAQEAPEAVAEGLNQPRHLSFGSDGTLYIAEAGYGGDQVAGSPAGSGEVQVGFTAQVTAVAADGSVSVFLPEQFSMSDPFAGTEGVSAVLQDGDYTYIVYGQGPNPDTAPDGAIFSAVVRYETETMAVDAHWDLLAFEAENNPDGTSDLASNPQDVAIGADGTVYAVDASGNSLVKLGEDGLVELVTSWPIDESGQTPSPVPTSIAIAPDGTLYVSFLSGYPFLQGAARIEHLNPDGTLIDTIENLTLVTDVQIGQDGDLYAVQFADGFGDTGYNQNTGSVIHIADDGTVTPVLEGLNFPYGLAQADDASWRVSINAAFSAEGSGSVIVIPAM